MSSDTQIPAQPGKLNQDTPDKPGLEAQLLGFMKDDRLGSAMFSGEDSLGPDDSHRFFMELTTLTDKKKVTKEVWDEGTKVRVIKTTQPAAIPDAATQAVLDGLNKEQE